jgi:formimidoylglutamate deiminase
LLDDSAHAIVNQQYGKLGFGVHSLRAVAPTNIIETYSQGPSDIPFHLHVAEQKKEVDDCVSFLKSRPVDWMLRNLPVDSRFNLVHCTHLTAKEVSDLASSGANVVLCPGTEGNLGDGIFKLTDFIKHDGRFCIGTDSQISLNMMEDLRWLDYTQRLTTHKRNTFNEGAHPLFLQAISNGRRANGIFDSDFFAVGQPLDAVVYDVKSPLVGQAPLDNLLATILYTADSSQIFGTIVNGNWIVKGMHKDYEQILTKFLSVMKSLGGVS